MNWLIDYNHPVDMSREYYFGWRPSYRNLIGIDKPIAVEVGVLEGFNTHFALKYIDFGKYYLVDPYKIYDSYDVGDLHKHDEQFWENLWERTNKRFRGNPKVEFVRKTSEEACKQFADGSLDFVYLDGDHTTKGITTDLHCWFPKVKSGGFIAGHDLNVDSVSSAVYLFFLEVYGDDPDLKFVEANVGTEYNDWWIRKV